MFKNLTRILLAFNFKEVALPLTIENTPITVMAPREKADFVEAFFEASSKVQTDLLSELHTAFNALAKSSGKTPEEDAERLIVLNTLRAKYERLFSSIDEINQRKKESNAT